MLFSSGFLTDAPPLSTGQHPWCRLQNAPEGLRTGDTPPTGNASGAKDSLTVDALEGALFGASPAGLLSTPQPEKFSRGFRAQILLNGCASFSTAGLSERRTQLTTPGATRAVWPARVPWHVGRAAPLGASCAHHAAHFGPVAFWRRVGRAVSSCVSDFHFARRLILVLASSL